MKIASFVSTIITLLLGIGINILVYVIIQEGSMSQGLEALGNIILIPIVILLLVASFGLSLSSLFTSVASLTSYSNIIRILSIFLLIISLALVSFMGYNLIQFVKLF